MPEIEAVREKPYVAPSTEMEREICLIFEEILAISPVGSMDNFFELGGHSLRAMKVMNKIEAVTGIRLPLKDLFENPTAKELAKRIEASKVQFLPIPSTEEKEEYLQSSTQKRLFIMESIDEPGTVYHMPVALRIEGALDLSKAKQAYQSLIHHHEILRTSFYMKDGEAMMRIHPSVEAELEYEEIQEEVANVDGKVLELMQQFVTPFQLNVAPLMRMKVVKLQKNDYISKCIFFDKSINIILDIKNNTDTNSQ